ncbi:MAG: SDR family oxidoreductase [Dehalococcoidales bacterium]|nr:MAG: SDR family oxidoreductase [Dehalococcoidales bacterium]
MIDPVLESKVVLITGANHGIGAATTRAFAQQGAKVFITYYREPSQYSDDELEKAREAGTGGMPLYRAMQQQSAEPLVKDIRSKGGTATACELDLGEASSIPKLFDQCEVELGPVDILVNNHAYCVYETFDPELTTGKDWDTHLIGPENIVRLVSADIVDAHFTINARAYALMMSEYTTRFLSRGAKWGRIINISTDAAHAHIANVSYAASKHAIESYSRSAAQELGKYGITVNIVVPGPIQTGYINPEIEDNIAANAPLRRVGQPEDVADVIVFMASEQARWLTGQLIYVGGGWRMHQ